MNIAIRYYTRGGNTEKLAKAVEEAVGVTAKQVTEALDSKADILFLGCSYYAFDMDEAVKKFIVDNKENIGEIVLFGTSAMMKSMKKPLQKVLKSLDVSIAVSDKEFHCAGAFGPVHKGKPDEKDIEAIKSFAKQFV
ncbi:MAG: flavodoxin [Lachnospiraceae bacterium]|nr:flavodoxin [Candidatus Merdinaster equi]